MGYISGYVGWADGLLGAMVHTRMVSIGARLNALIALAFGLLAVCANAQAVDARTIALGDAQIHLPTPPGMVDATDIQPFGQFASRMLPQSNDLLALYLPASDLEHVERREAGLSKYMMIQVARSRRSHHVTPTFFTRLSSSIKQNMDGLMAKANSQAHDSIAQSMADIKRDLDINGRFELGRARPLGVYHRSENNLGYLAFMAYMADIEGHALANGVLSATHVIHTKNRVLFVYAYESQRISKGVPSPLWVETAGTALSESIIRANR